MQLGLPTGSLSHCQFVRIPSWSNTASVLQHSWIQILFKPELFVGAYTTAMISHAFISFSVHTSSTWSFIFSMSQPNQLPVATMLQLVEQLFTVSQRSWVQLKLCNCDDQSCVNIVYYIIINHHTVWLYRMQQSYAKKHCKLLRETQGQTGRHEPGWSESSSPANAHSINSPGTSNFIMALGTYWCLRTDGDELI